MYKGNQVKNYFSQRANLDNIIYESDNEEKLYITSSDFKKKNGYKRSIELSKMFGLYRQDFCGCSFSKAQRELEKSAASSI